MELFNEALTAAVRRTPIHPKIQTRPTLRSISSHEEALLRGGVGGYFQPFRQGGATSPPRPPGMTEQGRAGVQYGMAGRALLPPAPSNDPAFPNPPGKEW